MNKELLFIQQALIINKGGHCTKAKLRVAHPTDYANISTDNRLKVNLSSSTSTKIVSPSWNSSRKIDFAIAVSKYILITL